MAQFAKFIRPGYRRIEATYQPQPGVFVAAFQGATTVIVAINQNPEAKDQAFTLANGAISAPRKYVTSVAKGLADEGLAGLAGDTFSASLDAQSITTFVATPTTPIRFRARARGSKRPGQSPVEAVEAYLPTGKRVQLPPEGFQGGWPPPLLPAP